MQLSEVCNTDKNDGIFSKNQEKKIQKKQKRFQHMIRNETGIICSDSPKQNLIICNAGLTTGLDQVALVSELTKFGKILNVHLLSGKSYCFVICSDKENASKIYDGAHGKCRLGQNESVIYLTYCNNVPSDCGNNEKKISDSLPPGLLIIEDFVTEEEESILIDLIKWNNDSATSNSTLKHRQVKHFGYEFRYDNNNVDVNKPLVDNEIPSECNFLWSKTTDYDISSKFIGLPHQLTVNKYDPGQGIPSHVDTHSAFTDTIVSLSLASDILMDFRKPDPINSKEYIKHVSILLPRRSLLIMSDEARYGWKHGITPRKIDVIQNADGHLTAKFRSMRISYTFRWLSNRPCYCKYHSICDTYQQSITNKDTDASNSIENPSKCELDNVHKVYNEIANHFSETRHSPWPQVADFLKRFQTGSILVDIGCGNGKYLDADQNTFKIGCDRSESLLEVCRERQFNIFQCDCLAVPIKSESVDGCISIAVIHHLASKERRIKAIEEMIRILRTNGFGLIYVWAKNQALKSKSSYLRQNKRNNKTNDESHSDSKDNSVDNVSSDPNNKKLSLPVHTNRTQFMHNDILVPWKLKSSIDENSTITDKNSKTFLRYYHVFEENELEEMCSQFDNILIEKSYYDQGNWCIIFKKVQK